MKNLFKKSPYFEDNKDSIHTDVYKHLHSVIKLDINGNPFFYNQAFTIQYGYDERDFKKPFLEVFIKDNLFKPKQYFEKAILGKKQTFNTIGICKNGKTIHVNVTLIPIKRKDNMDIYAIVKNIEKTNKTEKELLLLKKKQDAFNGLENICDFYYDVINDYYYFSNQLPQIFEVNAGQTFTPTFKLLLQYIHPDDRNRVRDTVQKALIDRSGYQIEYRILRKDQTVRYISEKAEIVLDENGSLDGSIGFIQDITNSKIAEDVLEKETQLTQIYESPDIGIWSINLKSGQWLNCSKGIEQTSGYTKEDFNNKIQWPSIVHPKDFPQYLENRHKLEAGNVLRHQYRIINKNGDIRWVQDYTIPTLDENGTLIQLDGLTSDITEQKVLKEKLKSLSDYDHLTKLPNRQKFYENLQSLTVKYTNSSQKFAIMMLNIDGLKFVNDTLGYQIGDELLIQIANRLSKLLTSDDMLARHGSNEFSILIGKMDSIYNLENVSKKIIEHTKEPFYIENYQLYVTASIGISIYPENGVSSLELLRNADLALYKSQKSGKNNYNIISYSSSIQSYKTFSIGRDLKNALENNEMVLYYQPRVDAFSNRIIGAEALIRWNHPEWGLISPHEFIKVAEESGLIKDVDDWVLKEVCNQISKWRKEQLHVVPISINISAVSFSIHNWHNTVARVIRNAGIYPHDLQIEITESLLLNNNHKVKDTISSLQALGIKIILDDFGKGFASLSYLTNFPFDVIKIDKSFIWNMLKSEKDLFIVKSILYMTKGLDIKVITEGVETIDQLKILQKEQCNEIQGYLFSHPVPVAEFKTLLQKKILPPMDPRLKAKRSKRKYKRLQFPYPLEADMWLVSIAGRSMQLGKSNILIEDMSSGGLRYISTLRLPTRGDVLFQFETEILGKTITLTGSIVWKEETYENLIEYGIKFVIDKDEQAALAALLNTFNHLLKNSKSIPPYKMVKEDRTQYFKRE